MKSEIIPITEHPNGVKTVNARELHAFLEIGKDYSTWIKDAITRYGFVEGEDFTITQDLSSPKMGSAKSRPQVLLEYHITLDMAKELAMLARTPKGRFARQYFIECEKRLREIQTALPEPKPQHPLEEEVTPVFRTYRAQYTLMIADGVKPETAAKLCARLLPSAREIDRQNARVVGPAAAVREILDLMEPGKEYGLDDIARLLGPLHTLIKGKKPPSYASSIGKLLKKAEEAGKLEKIPGRNARFLRLPDVVAFTSDQ